MKRLPSKEHSFCLQFFAKSCKKPDEKSVGRKDACPLVRDKMKPPPVNQMSHTTDENRSALSKNLYKLLVVEGNVASKKISFLPAEA